MLKTVLPVLVALTAAVAPAFAQSSSPAAHVSTADFSVNLGSRYAVVPNVTYLTATGFVSIPQLGLGVWQIPDEETTAVKVTSTLSDGVASGVETVPPPRFSLTIAMPPAAVGSARSWT